MRQLTLATASFDKHGKVTRRAAFLAEMERVVPWRELCTVIDPFYPKPGNGRPPVGLERMLRLHFLQQCWDFLLVGKGEIDGAVTPRAIHRPLAHATTASPNRGTHVAPT